MMGVAQPDDGLVTARAGRYSVTLDLSLGMIRELRLGGNGRTSSSLHRAPWLSDPAIQNDDRLSLLERRLSGDFFCAPFGASDVEPAPPHGWTANSSWSALRVEDGEMYLSLDRSVLASVIHKRLRLSADAPLLYQEHVISGGTGALTVAHHPMVRLAGRGRLTVSPKRVALTHARPLDPGRNRLARQSESTDLARFPSAEGDPLDLGDVPIGTRHEDFVTLIEAPGNALGWSAVLREAEDDIVFVLKDPRVLPVTMIWHSNGGRDYAPWNGRHTGVLGIEDGCTAGSDGHAASLADNPVARHGVPTALPLAPGRTHRIAHVIGVLPRPAGWRAIRDITLDGETLTLIEADGDSRNLPFQASFFSESS